ncbi:MAG TPA: DUF6152 family protein [Vicinamibacterales bacterium]|jgi:hypothetical protein
MPRSLSAVALGLLLSGSTISAHHAISAIYDNSKPITIQGTVVEFQFVNPHPFLVIDVVDEHGKSQPWKLEMDNRYELVEVGVTAGTFKHGDHVVATGGPARARTNGLYALRIDRASDGLRYEQIGTSPRITRAR